MWNNPIVGEELDCEHENTEVPQLPSQVQSFYIKHNILEDKMLANQSVICQIC